MTPARINGSIKSPAANGAGFPRRRIEPWMKQFINDLAALIVDYPDETLRVAGLVVIAGGILYFAREPQKGRALDAPGRILEDQAMLQHSPKSKRDRATA